MATSKVLNSNFIKRRIKTLNAEIDHVNSVAEAKVEKIKTEIETIQGKCDHPKVEHGVGYDRYAMCEICGKYL